LYKEIVFIHAGMVEKGIDGVDPEPSPNVRPEVEVGPVRRLDLKDPFQLVQLDPGILK
jgi:hypothetical protein